MRLFFPIFSIVCSFNVYAQAVQRVGTVVKISSAEVTIRHERGIQPLQMGDKLHILMSGDSVNLVVAYPMQSLSRCIVEKTDEPKIPFIRHGMRVFLGKANLFRQYFKDNNDGTVSDLRTGLVWSKNANITDVPVNFEDAVKAAGKVKIAGFTDWRLPTRDELNFFRNNQLLPELSGVEDPQTLRVFKEMFDQVDFWYWSSTTWNYSDRAAYIVNSQNGDLRSDPKSFKNKVWVVRKP